MHRIVTVETSASPEELYAVIADLGTYPHWCDVVVDTEAIEGPIPAWLVTLRAKVGPFARSKQLRVLRRLATGVGADGVARARYERAEVDDKDHADWIMDTTVRPLPNGGSELTLELEYSGGLWTGPLDGILGREVDKAISRLPAFVTTQR